jgi:c-di-GMP-related signal transduction protein
LVEVFLARQPIFDRTRQLNAYELLFRADGASGEFDGTDSTAATLQVLANALLSFGLENILVGKRAFVNFDRTLLTSGMHTILPKESIVLELLETVEPSVEVTAACADLHNQGYTIALDDFVSHPNMEPLIPFVKILKVDMRSTPRPEMERLVRAYRPRGIAMLAEKVETQEEFDWAHRSGYDLFQGFFFARPGLVRCQQVSSTKITCLRLIGELQSEELDFTRIENLVSQDASLCYKLLRYVNSGLFCFRVEIRTIKHALVTIGLPGIRHWIALAAVPALAKDRPFELVMHTLVRARFAERIAELAGVRDPGRAFLMGILSLLDALIGVPLEEALNQVMVDPSISGALLGTSMEHDVFRVVHTLVCKYEEADWDAVGSFASELGIRGSAVAAAYAEATLWARQSLRATSRKTNTRRFVRHPITGAIRLLWQDPSGGDRLSRATLVNVSTQGLQIILDEKIPVQTRVCCNDPAIGIAGTGSVRYCNYSKGKYLIGLEFSSGTGWQPPAALAPLS